jgi:anaerobic ribonucleoside-triphosphate reductase
MMRRQLACSKKAKAALEAYFSEKSLLQKDPEPDLKISDKDNAKNQTKGVLSLLDMIIEDLQGELLETKDAEEAAQLAYEEMKKAVEEQKAKLEKAKINLEGQIAQENTAKDAETDLQEENEKKLTTEKETEVDLKKTCDDAIKLQPERRKKRAIEMDGLRMAKEFLGGMTSDALLQSPQSRSEKSVFPAFQTLSFLQVKSAL